jgi:hypothetical protein
MYYRSTRPGEVIGYRKDGTPIRLIAGGAPKASEETFAQGTQEAPGLPQGEEPVEGAQPPTPPPTPKFTAEDIAKAREEEKTKLYRQQEKLKTESKAMRDELTQLRQWREEQKAAEEAQRAVAEEEARKRAEEEMSAKQLIAAKDQEWRERLEAIERQRNEERAALEKERQFASLRAYIAQRAREEQDNIAPELIDLINGNTEDEVETSIAMLRSKTEAIVSNLSQAQTTARAAQRGVSTAGYAATGPMDNEPGTKTYTPDEISSMPMSEWEKIRGRVIGAANASSRGMFG